MSKQKENEIIHEAFEIIKRRLEGVNNYTKDIIDLYNPFEVKTLNQLTKISIPGFGCFYISGATASRGPGANPRLRIDDYAPDDVIYFRQLRFRPYSYFRCTRFRMTRSYDEMKALVTENANAANPKSEI